MIEVKLKDITLNITDGKHGDCESEENSGFYFISCKDIHDGAIHYQGARQITEHAYIDTHKRTMLEPNDILVTNSGTIGRMALVKNVPETFRTTFQKSVAIIKPNQEVVRPVYLYYSLLNCVNQFINQSNGAAQKNLLLGTMREFRLSIEESVEQQDKIANVLRTYDILIENNQKQIKLLEEAAQCLYKEWFVDLRFPGYKKTKIDDGMPEGWKIRTLEKIAVLKAGGDKPLFFSKNKDVKHVIPVFSNGTDNEGLYGYTDKATIINNSVTISARGSVGYTCLRREPYVPIVRLISVIPYNIDVSYIYLYLKNSKFDSNGAAQQQITVPMIKEKEVLIPTKIILQLFADIVRPIYDQIDNHKNQNIRLIEIRNRLLPKLMNGEIEV